MNRNIANSSLRAALLTTVATVGLLGMSSAANAAAYGLAETTLDNVILTLSTPGANPFNSFSFTTSSTASFLDAAGHDIASSDATGAAHSAGIGYTNTHNNAGIDNCFTNNSSAGSCAFAGGALANGSTGHPAVTTPSTSGVFTPVGKEAGQNYSFAASALVDTLINGTAGAPAGGGGFTKNIAEANTTGGLGGKAQAGKSVQTWNFSLNLTSGETVGITYSALVSLIADSSDPLAGKVTSTSTVDFKLLGLGTNCTHTINGSPQIAGCDAAPQFDNQTVQSPSQAGAVKSTDYELDTLGGIQTVSKNGGAPTSAGSFNGSPGLISVGITAGSTGLFTFSIEVNDTVQTASTPEPATMSILGAGLLGLGAVARRRRNRKAA